MIIILVFSLDVFMFPLWLRLQKLEAERKDRMEKRRSLKEEEVKAFEARQFAQQQEVLRKNGDGEGGASGTRTC